MFDESAIAGAMASSHMYQVIGSLDLLQELFKIHNISDQSISVAGWTLVSVTGDQRLSLPTVDVPPKQCLTVLSGKDSHLRCTSPLNVHWTNRYIWNNSGDSALVLDAAGRTVLLVEMGLPDPTYPATAEGISPTELLCHIVRLGLAEKMPVPNLDGEALKLVYDQHVVPLVHSGAAPQSTVLQSPDSRLKTTSIDGKDTGTPVESSPVTDSVPVLNAATDTHTSGEGNHFSTVSGKLTKRIVPSRTHNRRRMHPFSRTPGAQYVGWTVLMEEKRPSDYEDLKHAR